MKTLAAILLSTTLHGNIENTTTQTSIQPQPTYQQYTNQHTDPHKPEPYEEHPVDKKAIREKTPYITKRKWNTAYKNS